MGVFPELTLPALLSSAVRRPQPNTLIGLKTAPPMPGFQIEPEAQTEQPGPTVARAALAGSPLPPVKPPELGGAGPDAPLPPSRPNDQTAALSDLFKTFQYGVPGSGPGASPTYTALNLGKLFGGG